MCLACLNLQLHKSMSSYSKGLTTCIIKNKYFFIFQEQLVLCQVYSIVCLVSYSSFHIGTCLCWINKDGIIIHICLDSLDSCFSPQMGTEHGKNEKDCRSVHFFRKNGIDEFLKVKIRISLHSINVFFVNRQFPDVKS